MKDPVIPDPALVRRPAIRRVRFQWIGRFVRIGRRHMKEPYPRDPEYERIVANQIEYRERGVGEALDVAKADWFPIRRSNGKVNKEWNKVLGFQTCSLAQRVGSK